MTRQAVSARGHRTRRVKSSPNPRALGYAPRDLSENGRRAWRNAVQSAPWLDAGADLDLLHRYAALHDERAELAATIASDGRLTTGSTGQTVEHPAVRMLASVDERILKLSAALGLGPAARHRLTGKLEAERDRPALAPVTDLYERMTG